MRRTRRPKLPVLGLALSAALGFAGQAARALDFDGRGGGGLPEPVAAPPTGDVAEMDPRYWVVVRAAGKAERSRIADAGVSIEEVANGTVAGVASPEALRKLEAMGVSFEKKMRLHEFGPEGFPKPDEAYHDYGEVQAELEGLAAGNKGVASLIQVGSSIQGRKIAGVRFNTTAKDLEPSSKPGIVFMGSHHAREHLSTEVPLLVAKWLADNQDKPEVKRLLETRDIYFIPLVNPDGSEYDIETGRYRWQRKNMRPNGGGTVGVDLNRNYGFHWGEGGASTDPGSDTYRGTAPFSEPETQAIKNFVEARPNLKILLSYHTFSELILYPWGHSYDPIPDGRALSAYKAMAARMAQWTGYTPEQSSDLYIASGDTTDWAWGAKKIFSFTFELTPRSMWSGGFYPGAAAIATTFAKNVDPALYLIDLADDPARAAGSPSARAPLKPLAPILSVRQGVAAQTRHQERQP